MTDIRSRIAKLDWPRLEANLRRDGHARTGPVLDLRECQRMAALHDDEAGFRKRIQMQAHGYGVGDYAYFEAPLPQDVVALREAFYCGLAPLANRMMQELGDHVRYPAQLGDYLDHCHRLGQERSTPLLLRYDEGGYNRLHRDLYGPEVFPLQVTIVLSRPGVDYEGGEFLLLEQRARQQSRGEAIALEGGEAIIFPSYERPLDGKRGVVRAAMRHGLSRVRRGRRQALGLIFHDAQ